MTPPLTVYTQTHTHCTFLNNYSRCSRTVHSSGHCWDNVYPKLTTSAAETTAPFNLHFDLLFLLFCMNTDCASVTRKWASSREHKTIELKQLEAGNDRAVFAMLLLLCLPNLPGVLIDNLADGEKRRQGRWCTVYCCLQPLKSVQCRWLCVCVCEYVHQMGDQQQLTRA